MTGGEGIEILLYCVTWVSVILLQWKFVLFVLHCNDRRISSKRQSLGFSSYFIVTLRTSKLQHCLSTDHLSLSFSLTHSSASAAPAVYKGLGGKPSARLPAVGNRVITGIDSQPSGTQTNQNSTNWPTQNWLQYVGEQSHCPPASDHCHPEYSSQHSSPPTTSTTGRSTDSDALPWTPK